MEMAGIRNGFGKQNGGSNAMNNAKAAILALTQLRTPSSYARVLGVPVEEILARQGPRRGRRGREPRTGPRPDAAPPASDDEEGEASDTEDLDAEEGLLEQTL